MRKPCKTCGKIVNMFSWEDECFSCKQKKYHAEIKRQILGGEIKATDCESEIYCPYCGEIYEIDDEYDLYEEGDHETYCGNCDKTFTVSTRVSHYFDTGRIESEG